MLWFIAYESSKLNYCKLTETIAKESYRYGTQQEFAFGESGLFYQIRILSKEIDASVEIFGGSTHMNPTVTDSKPIFKIDKGQQLKVWDEYIKPQNESHVTQKRLYFYDPI